jgi:hypothetical protein
MPSNAAVLCAFLRELCLYGESDNIEVTAQQQQYLFLCVECLLYTVESVWLLVQRRAFRQFGNIQKLLMYTIPSNK